MPDGVLMWFDPKTGRGEIIRHGRLFPARAHDVETVARRAGARVHFDIRRTRGMDMAVGVRLRTGTRVSHRHHGFGTLAGARRIDSKGVAPYAGAHPELPSPVMRPLELARAWAESLVRGDVTGAMSLYAPDACVHVGEEALTGRASIHGWLEASPLLGSGRRPRVRGDDGDDGTVSVTWAARAPDEPEVTLRCRVAHAQIAEQWVPGAERSPGPSGTARGAADGGPATTRTAPTSIVVSTKGDVGAGVAAQAAAKIRGVLETFDEPVLFARVKLAWEPDPARPRPAEMEAAVDLNGDVLRAGVAARTMSEASDLLVARVRDGLEHRAQHRIRLHRRRAVAEEGAWRHGDLPTPRPAYFDRPAEDRQLVRRRTFAVDDLTPDEAVLEMEQLGERFLLFRDLAGGHDALVERLADGRYLLTRVTTCTDGPVSVAGVVDVSAAAVPALRLDEALERLEAGGEPLVFFVDPASARGNVLYRRDDGHYGLIVPV